MGRKQSFGAKIIRAWSFFHGGGSFYILARGQFEQRHVPKMIYKNLNADKALIWRIVHRDNLPWILNNGLHCRNSATQDPNYANIGNPELIDKRAHRSVPIPPHGSLSDYVPFYFTPFSVMMMNIHSGRGVKKRSNAEIVILVSSLHWVHEQGIPFLFTNGHAYPPDTQFFSRVGCARRTRIQHSATPQ